MNVWINEKYSDKKFVYLRKGGFENYDGSKYKIDAVFVVTDNMIVEKSTGIAHSEAEYFDSFEVPFTY